MKIKKICVYDPKVSEQQMLTDLDYLNSRSSEENKNALIYYSDPLKACENSHGVAVITEWDEFKTYDWYKIYDCVISPAKVFDGRNILNKVALEEIGFEVFSIGK